LTVLKASLQKTETGYQLTILGTYNCSEPDCTIRLGRGLPTYQRPVGNPLVADKLHGTFRFNEPVKDVPPIDWYVEMIQAGTNQTIAVSSGITE
jgi:hypothetical protein